MRDKQARNHLTSLEIRVGMLEADRDAKGNPFFDAPIWVEGGFMILHPTVAARLRDLIRQEVGKIREEENQYEPGVWIDG